MSGEYVFLLGNMNARVGSTEIGGVVEKYGVDGVSGNGHNLVDICAERGLFLSNTFQHKMIHRYTWARANERSLLYSCGQQAQEGGTGR